MYKETCKTTKCIDFKIQKYSLSMTIQYHSDTHSCYDMATVSWEIMCVVPSHGIPIGTAFLWTSLMIFRLLKLFWENSSSQTVIS